MFGAFDEHIEHLVGDILNFITFNLVNEPVEDLLFDGEITYTIANHID